MATETVLDLKRSFLQSQLRLLSTPFSIPRDWQTQVSQNSDNPLPVRLITDALYHLNQNLRVHNLATYSAQAVRHVAEALDALYWAESEPDRNEDLGEALERGRDFRIDSHAEALPSEWPEEVYEEEVADAERYQELQAQLLDLLERKQEAQRMLGTYRKLGGLLDPFNDPRNTIQPNLVTRNGELAKELERMRILVARVGGRIGTLSSLTGKRADIQTSESVQGADKLNALFDSWQ